MQVRGRRCNGKRTFNRLVWDTMQVCACLLAAEWRIRAGQDDGQLNKQSKVASRRANNFPRPRPESCIAPSIATHWLKLRQGLIIYHLRDAGRGVPAGASRRTAPLSRSRGAVLILLTSCDARTLYLQNCRENRLWDQQHRAQGTGDQRLRPPARSKLLEKITARRRHIESAYIVARSISLRRESSSVYFDAVSRSPRKHRVVDVQEAHRLEPVAVVDDGRVGARELQCQTVHTVLRPVWHCGGGARGVRLSRSRRIARGSEDGENVQPAPFGSSL